MQFWKTVFNWAYSSRGAESYGSRLKAWMTSGTVVLNQKQDAVAYCELCEFSETSKLIPTETPPPIAPNPS